MGIDIHEVRRTFREFYPDLTARNRAHYEFAHRFLPQYVHHNPHAFFSYLFHRDVPGGAMEPTRFIHSRWTMFEQMAGFIPPNSDPSWRGLPFRRVAELSMSTHHSAGRPLALVQMPSPEQPAGAFFVACTLLASAARPESWPHDAQARVLTLEAKLSPSAAEIGTGLVCEWTRDGDHRNFGLSVPADRDSFLRAVTAVVSDPNRPAPAGWSPPKQGAPATNSPHTTANPPPPRQPTPPSLTKRPWWKIW